MGSSKQLVFDTTDAGTIAASDSVGAFVRSSDGTLIDKEVVNSVNRLAVDSTLKDGAGTALTSTLDGAKQALDVHVANDVNVTATNLDIRDLAFATDSVTAHQGGTWTIDSITNAVTVSATNLDIRDLSSATDSVTAVVDFSHAEDAAHVSGDKGAFALAVRNDAGTSMVSADGDYAPLQVDAAGALRVSGSFTVNPADNKAEDSAHTSGDVGSYMLGVREDVLSTSTSATGDYQSIKSDKWGRTWTNESHQDWKVNKISVVVAGGQILASALAGRKRIYVQNKDKKPIYLKESGTAITDGVEIGANSGWIELLLNENCALYAQSISTTADVRIIEMA